MRKMHIQALAVLFGLITFLNSVRLQAQNDSLALPQTYIGAGPDVYGYESETIRLYGNGGISYTWTPSTGLDDAHAERPYVTVSDTTTYIVHILLSDSTTTVDDTVTVFIVGPPSIASSCSNLVANGNLETYGTCPPSANTATTTTVLQATGWINPNAGTPDYYNACATYTPGNINCVNVPNTGMGYLWGHGGSNGMIGLVGYAGGACSGGITGYDWTEYAQKNICPLLTGQTYSVTLYVACPLRSGYASGELGAYFSNGPISGTLAHHFTNVPQVGTGTNCIGTNTLTTTVGTTTSNVGPTTLINNTIGNWATLTNTIIGAGQNYVTLGCFYSGSNPTLCTLTGPINYKTYYFFDDLIIKALPPVITTTNVIACSNSTFTMCATGGANYTWSFPWTSTTYTGSCVSVVAPTVTASTVYTATVSTILTCPVSCTLTTTQTLTVNPNPTVTVNSASVCPGSSTTLTANGASTYTWSANAGGATTSTVSVSPSSTTVYTVTGTANSCTNSATSTVTVYSPPTLTASNYTICNGSSATATVSGASTYTWNPGNLTGSSVVLSPTVTTTYTINGTDANGCVGTKTISVTVNPKPTLSPTATPSLICSTLTTNTTSLSVSGASTYTWTAAPSSALSCTACTSPTATLTGLPGSFTFTVTGTAATTCTNSATITVTVNPTPSLTITSTSASVCPGLTATLTASGASTYTWSANAGSATTSTVAVSPTVTTVYTVTGSSGGCANTKTYTLNVYPVTQPTFTGTLCAGVTGTLSVGPGSYTYTWSPSTGTNSVSPSTGTVVTVNNPSGTYTVNGTTGNGCAVSATYSTNPLPSVSISTTPTNSYCAYAPQTITLTASGAASYTWSANAGGGTSSTATVSPSVTTTYTVTGTSSAGCSNTAISTVTVVPTPTIAPTASPNPVCQFATTTLTATGATTYTWNPGSLSGSSITVTPTSTSTTVYTVTGTQSTCTASATISLSVTPAPTLTVSSVTSSACNYSSPSNSTICAGGSATLTATGASTYTWNPGALTSASAVVSPTVTTTYTVTGNNGTCNGTNTLTITVSTCTCSGTALPTLSNTVISGGTYVLNGNATVSGTVTLSNTEVFIAGTYSINVPNGASLTIRNTHLSACYNMWQGITVAPGGTVNVIANSLIEDAVVAIDNNPSNTQYTSNPPTINVNGAVFNCNRTGIRQAHYESSTNADYGTAYFNVNDAVFTCRCGITYPITTSTLTVYTNTGTVTANPSTPDLSDIYSVNSYTVANPRIPNNTNAAQEGIKFETNGHAQVETISPVNFCYKVGGATLVLFDNLVYGINATNTSFTVTNTAYQNQRYNRNGLGQLTIGGYGIIANNNDPDRYNGLYALQNRFIDMVRAVHCTNYFDQNFEYNTLWSKQTIVPYGGSTGITPPRGQYGVYFSTPRFYQASISSNNIANINNVVVFSIPTATYVGGNGQHVGEIAVNNNSMADQFTGNSYTSRYIGTGIAVTNIISPASGNTAPISGTNTAIYAKTNTITACYNGIYMANHQFQRPRTELNTIVMQYYPTNTTEQVQYGINHASCNMYSSGYGSDIYSNTVTGYFASSYTFNTSNQATFEKKKGILSQYCGNHYVTCNAVSTCGRGFEFAGAHTKIYWAKNTMSHDGEAYSITNSGVIGTQNTASTTANDNQWTSTSNTFGDTYTDASSAPGSSVLWLQGTTLPYVPGNNQTGSGTAYSGATLIQSKPACSYTCSLPPNSRMSSTSGRSTNDSLTADIDFLESIVQDSLPYPAFSEQNTFINKNMAYRMIHRNPSLLNSTVLASFYSQNNNSSWAIFTNVEDSLYSGNYGYADELLNSHVFSSGIEQNYRRFYQIYSSVIQGNYSTTDSEDLLALASSCPMLNGTVVFQARALRNDLLNGFENYEDNCPTGNTQKSSSEVKHDSNKFQVYPNPTNGKFYIIGFAATEIITQVIVTDISGKLISNANPQLRSGQIELSLEVENGVYFIKVTSSQAGTQVHKIIINR